MSTVNDASGDPKAQEGRPAPGPAFVAALRRGVRGQMAVVWLAAIAMIPLSHLFSAKLPSAGMLLNVIPLVLFLVLVSFGQGMVILSGGFDLSVAASVTLGAYSTGYLTGHGAAWPLSCLLALALCALCGALNGALVAYAGFQPFIVTLAVGSIVAAGLLGVSSGQPGQQSPPALAALFGHGARLAGVPYSLFILVLAVAAGWLIQHKSVLGSHAAAIGGSYRAATLAGLRVRRDLTRVYAVAGAAYGIAGILLLGYAGSTDLTIGASWQMQSVAAVAVGGSAMSGGSGAFLCTVGASALLELLSTDISAAGSAEGWKQVMYGGIIALSLIVTHLSSSRKR